MKFKTTFCFVLALLLNTSLFANSECSSLPIHESFETGLGIWNQANNDDFDWTSKSGGTPSGGTGPTSAIDGSKYLYTEVSNPNYPNKVAALQSSCIDLKGYNKIDFTFQYHMLGSTAMGGLNVLVSEDNGSTWVNVFSKFGPQSTDWLEAEIDLSAFGNKQIKIKFEGNSGTTWKGDIAIDNISITGESTNVFPTVSITSPLDLQEFNTPELKTIKVDANDTDGSIVKVDFYINDEILSTDLEAPYTYDYDFEFGTYTIKAVATDEKGATSEEEINIYIINEEERNCEGSIINTEFEESFENGLTYFNQNSDDYTEWTVYSGGTKSSQTGPNDASKGTYYIYVEASNPNYPGKSAIITSNCIDVINLDRPTISFDRHMLGSGMGSLKLQISTDSGESWSDLYSESGNQGTEWETQNIDLTPFKADIFKLRFNALTGNSYKSDIALDNIKVYDKGTSNQNSYCNASSTNSNYEWIEKVTINGQENISGNDNGYGEYTSITNTITKSSSVEIELMPKFYAYSYEQTWSIWVDYNQDGQFSIDEQVYTSNPSTTIEKATFTIPESATNGNTRMRISMKSGYGNDNACGTFDFGEVEDYSLNITDASSVSKTLSHLSVYPNPIINNTTVNLGDTNISLKDAKVSIIDRYGKVVSTSKYSIQNGKVLINTYNINNGYYIIKVESDKNIWQSKVYKK